MRYYHCLRDEQERAALYRWWQLLNNNRGMRARLRRITGPDDAMLTDGFRHFLNEMQAAGFNRWAQPGNLAAAALMVAVLAHVKHNHSPAGKAHSGKEGERLPASFAEQLAIWPAGKNRAAMSELRFRQLQQSDSPEVFFRRLIRAIQLLDGKVNLLSLADSILHWHREYSQGLAREPQQRLAVRWATEYYSH